VKEIDVLDEILNPGQESEKVEAPEPVEPQGEVEQEGGAPTAPQNDPHVPLAALEAERKGRQDWKEKAIRAEEQLRQYEQQQQRTQAPPADPLQSMQQQIINERFNTSEMLVRNQHTDTDEVVEVFMEAAKANPALAAALQAQRHPWQFAYNEGKRMRMLKEVGDDPAAYRAKVEAEVMAKLQQSQPAPALNLPASLNGARSTGARSAPGWNGPTPFDALMVNK
jgi:hypothetical protein